jgi:hypothetical protein
MAHGLTPKQFLFCEYYIQTLNGVLSAELAGYKGSYSVHGVVAHDNLKKPKIKAYLNKRWQEVAMGTDEMLARLEKIACAIPADFLNEGGGIDWVKVRRDGYAIKSITHTKGKQSKIELEPRLRALELLGKAQAMFTDRIEIIDWREEMAKAGIPASEIFEEYVKQFMKVQKESE